MRQQPIDRCHGGMNSRGDRLGMPKTMDLVRCAEHRGHRGCRAKRYSMKVVKPPRSIALRHLLHNAAGQSTIGAASADNVRMCTSSRAALSRSLSGLPHPEHSPSDASSIRAAAADEWPSLSWQPSYGGSPDICRSTTPSD